MPELPDLAYIRPILEECLAGKTVSAVEVSNPLPLRIAFPEPPDKLLVGRRLEGVDLRGPFLTFRLSGPLFLVMNLMLTGRLGFSRLPHHCFSLSFGDSISLFYGDQKQMGRIYLFPEEGLGSIPLYLEQGLDILSQEFTPERFLPLLEGRRVQARVFLMDQRLLSAVGNAYADEILFQARIHPKTPVNRLTPEERSTLFDAVREVIHGSLEIIRRAAPPIHRKYREHLNVRGKKGLSCPRCGSTIRRTQVHGYDSFFCPSCQRAPEGQLDWSRLG